MSPTPIGVFTWPEGRIVEANEALLAMLGQTRAELDEQTAADLGLFEAIAGSKQTVAVSTRDGGERWCRTSIQSLELDGELQIVCSLTDITHERCVQETLRETNETLRALVAACPVAIDVVDLDDRVKLWNPAAERLFGWPKEEVLGKRLPYHVPEAIGDRERTIQALWRGDVLSNVATERLRKDGKKIDVQLSAAPMRDASGRIVGAVRVLQDVTQERTLEAQLRQSQKMEAIGRLAGGVAHDFNNLLTVILSGSEFLIEALEHRRPISLVDVEDIKKAAKRAAALTHQLLAFSRRQVLAPKILDLNAMVSNTDKMLNRLIGEDIRLETKLDSMLGLVRADPSQIEQMILNLVVNARDAMPEGGTVTIETSNTTHSPPGAPKGRWVRLSVKDTGVGMDAITKSRLFEPFFTSKDKGKGTGLGLATVYGIVQQSSGFITVDSQPGQGARFDVYLPQVLDAERSESQMTGEIIWTCGRETILLVEDDDAVRGITSRALRDGGYKVFEAPNGERALSLVQKINEPVHLLVSDVVMPGIGGRELSERIRTILPRTKVLFISGYTDDEILRRGLLRAEIDLLPKPFSPHALLDRVRSLLDEAGAAA